MKIIKQIIISFTLIFLCACSKKAFPNTVSESDLNGDFGKTLFRYFGQYLDTKDKTYSTKMGKVLVRKQEDYFLIGFYEPTKDSYELIGEPIKFENCHAPHASADRNANVACIQAYKKDGGENLVAYVLDGEVIIKNP